MAEQKNSQNLDARNIAIALIQSLLREAVFFDILLERNKAYHALDFRDQKFTYKLCLDLIRSYQGLTLFLASKIKRFKKLPLKLRVILMLALIEKYQFNTPDYALVNNAIELVKSHKLVPFKALVNGVLRGILKSHPDEGSAFFLSPQFPSWMQDRLKVFYDKASILKMQEASYQIPPLDMHFKTERDAAMNFEVASNLLSPKLRRFEKFFPFDKSDAFQQGKFWIQDYAATRPILECPDQIKDKQVLDLCAAPGGKTMQLIALGAKVTALDQSKSRLKKLKENLTRCSMQAEIICKDFLELPCGEKLYDIVLLDAPCSATGTIRKHPELPLINDGSGVASLIQLQEKLLSHAALFVKPGGLLIYCTCSLFHEEGEIQIAAFLKEGWQLESQKRIMPHSLDRAGGSDGFYFAYLRRN